MVPKDENRFSRTELLLGPEALGRLRAAFVVVAGLGAVGSYCAEALARAGVGRLRVVDFDVIRPSNVNRQLYALESTLGRPKTEVARARILDINPECRVEAMGVFVDAATAPAVLEGSPAAVVDAIDSLGPKLALLEAAVARELPIVSSMGAATRTDPFLVRVGDISETEGCPLARLIRKRLKRRGIASGVRCVYSIEPAGAGLGPVPAAPDAAPRGRVRRPLGSLSYMTGIFGLLAAREVIGLLLSLGGAAGPAAPAQ